MELRLKVMDVSQSFMNLENKKKSLVPILSEYDFISAVSVIYSITSWRYNRGAQESCLALNSTLFGIQDWGQKTISNEDEYKYFFNQVFPILQITLADDPVLPDFGEIKLNYRGKYYSVITGTGHTAPVFSALQFLDEISKITFMESYTENILSYSDRILTRLIKENALIDSSFSLTPSFETPSFNYYKAVRSFIESKEWLQLDERILNMLSSETNDVVRSHFFKYGKEYYPLFNPSIIIDYQIHLLSAITENSKKCAVISSLASRLFDIYSSNTPQLNHVFRNCLLVEDKSLLLGKNVCFAYMDTENLIIFLDCAQRIKMDETINKIKTAYNQKSLSIVDLDDPKGSGYKAYQVYDRALNVICFDEYINIDETKLLFGSRNKKRIYTAVDLMYMLMYSSDISQIVKFDNDDKNPETQVFSWGGVSDFYTAFLSEKGYISKGALELNGFYFEIDTSAAYIFSLYLNIEKIFPFHLSSNLFPAPESWSILCDDTEVYQFTRKSHGNPCGALYKYKNGCTVFLAYDLLSILKENNLTQAKLSLDFYRSIVERFFKDFYEDISSIEFLSNTFIQFICRSLSEKDSSQYVFCDNISKSGDCISIDTRVNCTKIENDIAIAENRTIEFLTIKELIQPLICQSKDLFSDILDKMDHASKEKKAVSATSVQIDYYFNPNTYDINTTDESELLVRKQIAMICLEAGVLPGTYEHKEATEVVRTIQESVVNQFEELIKPVDQVQLHEFILSAIATAQLSININRNSAFITKDLNENEKGKALEKTTQLYEDAKSKKAALIYLLESNLFVSENRGNGRLEEDKFSTLLSYAKWLTYLQNISDLCFHTDSDTSLIVLEDFRIDVMLGDHYLQVNNKEKQRRILSKPYNLKCADIDKKYIESVIDAFYQDTGVNFKVLEAVMHQLSNSNFSKETVNFDEVVPNVIRVNASDAINDYSNFIIGKTPINDVKKAYSYLIIDSSKLKNIDDTPHPILPIWEREKRNHCFAVRPVVTRNDDYIYSPIVLEELRKRWLDGLFQFYLPFEIGLEKTCQVLNDWKNHYEHLLSSDVESLLKSAGCEYAKHDVDLRREDRNGNHPSINVLGDYDVIGLSVIRKEIYVIECKVLRPIGSVFEHSSQQKNFFYKKKYDEKFQRRIDYFTSIANDFFASKGITDTKGFKIMPYMVVNKVFSSYYKAVRFPIVTYDELKQILFND